MKKQAKKIVDVSFEAYENAQATEPVATSTFTGMATTLTAEPVAAKTKKIITAEEMLAGVTVGSTAGVLAAKHVVAKQLAGSMSTVPAAIAASTYVLGRPCRVRVPHTITAYAACSALLASGAASGAALVAASDSSFVPYAIKNQWLVAA